VQVNLTGAASDPDGNIVSYSWTQVGGPQVAISGANTSNASFTAPSVSSSETLEFRFEVTDDDNAIGSDTVQVTVNDVSPTSTANIGDLISSLDQRFASETSALESEQNTAQAQAIASGTYLSGGYLSAARNRFINHLDSFFNYLYAEAIRLTENGTFFSRSEIIAELDWRRSQWQTYLDQFLSSSFFDGHSTNDLSAIGQDVLVAIDNAVDNALSRLEASERLVGSGPPENQAPTANAGADQTANEGWTVSLSGSGSDADGFIVSFNWQQDSGTGVVITDANMEFASFVTPMVDATEELIFRFVVTDDDGAIGSDTMKVTINDDPTPPANQPPTADAGANQSVDEGITVNLIGLGTDSDGTIVSYNWQQDSGTSVSISDADTANASFIAPEVEASEDLEFSLTVTDDDGDTGSDSVTITVIDVPPPILDWSIELNDPAGSLGPSRPLLITGILTNSEASNMNLGVIGGTFGVPPGFDYEIDSFGDSSSGYLFNWAPDGPESFIGQFEGVNLAPGASFDFEFARLSPDGSVSVGATYTASLEIQLFEAPRSGPMIGSGFDSVSWIPDDFGLVFVTSQTFDGALGGIQGADDKCNAAAAVASLAGTYVAWISDSATDAKDRITDQGYITIAGDIVANSLTDLIDGTIGVPIDVDENRSSIIPGSGIFTGVWTNTTPDGVNFEPFVGGGRDACGDWTTNASDRSAAMGRIDETGVQWSGGGGTNPCNNQGRLYCFEQ
jgi:hypothetical protein